MTNIHNFSLAAIVYYRAQIKRILAYFFYDMVKDAREQSPPNPAEEHKMFANAEKLKCPTKHEDQIQDFSKNVPKV
jgi:hypothetical protein